MDRCPACDCTYTSVEYQARSADEPPRRITYCAHCPLDARKLVVEPQFARTTATGPTLKSTPRVMCVPRVLTGSKTSKHYIRVQCLARDSNTAAMFTSMSAEYQRRVIVRGEPEACVEMSRVSSVGKVGPYHITSESLVRKLAPGIDLVRIVTRNVRMPSGCQAMGDNGTVWHEATRGRTVTLPGLGVVIAREDMRSHARSLYIDTDGSMRSSMRSVTSVMASNIIDINIRSHLGPELVMGIDAIIARGYDVSKQESSESMFTAKVDGERFLLVRYACVWLFIRRLRSWNVAMWRTAWTDVVRCDIGPVLDVEVVPLMKQPVFIDLLVDESGALMSHTRTLETVIDAYESMANVNRIAYVRRYYRSKQDAMDGLKGEPFVSDGVVEFIKGGVDIAKHKPVKSVELIVSDDGHTLSTSDDIAVATSQSTLRTGSVIELRFTVDESNAATVHESLVRMDKTKANDYAAYKSIVQSTRASIKDSPLVRREVVAWSSLLRETILTMASAASSSKFIIDIGAGDGRGIQAYEKLDVSMLLLEPDKMSWRKLCAQVKRTKKGGVVVADGVEETTSALGRLVSGSVRYVASNCDASFINNRHIRSVLRKYCGHMTSIFSASRCCEDIIQASSIGVPMTACCYVYDDADEKGCIVDIPGVLMKRLSDGTGDAMVRWGSDKTYTERAIVSADFIGSFRVQPASVLESITRMSNVASSICKHVRILTVH